MWPRYVRPIWSGSGCVQRVPSGAMTTTKATSAWRRSDSAYGWSAADGSAERAAAATDGESATAAAVAVAWRRAVSSACARSVRYAKTAHPATTTATSTTCIAKSWPARLRGRGSRESRWSRGGAHACR